MNMIERTDLKAIVDRKARYQKVMLLYDDNVTNIEINSVYNELKEVCIFNHANISIDVDFSALGIDGYRLIVYYCSTDNFIKLNLDRQDFVNVFIPIDNGLLPYFLNKDFELRHSEDYLVRNNNVDSSAIGSIYFNKVLSCIRSLVTVSSQKISVNFSPEISNATILRELEALLDGDVVFCDIDILRFCEISYDKLPMIDYILLSALLTLVNAVKQRSLSLIDVYKAAGEDYALIDRFYAMYNNESLIGLINLNFFYISNLIEGARDRLIEIVPLCCEYNKEEVENLIDKIKKYSKQDDGIIGYLYLYNIFST